MERICKKEAEAVEVGNRKRITNVEEKRVKNAGRSEGKERSDRQ